MLFVPILIIAVVILVYFSFFSGSGTASTPKITDDTIEDSVIIATVRDKLVEEGATRRRSFLTYHVTFDCDDGELREFDVDNEIYEAIEIGEQNQLVYAGTRFVGFGDHGAVDDDAVLNQSFDDGFTYDDYDENIDVEMDLESPRGLELDAENQEYLAQFRGRQRLPVKVEIVEDETDSLAKYSALALPKKITLYPFLKRESEIRGMFVKTYDEAMQDMLGYEGDSRKGSSADSIFINKNEFRVVITLQELPYPLKSKVTAEFGVNE